jgi:plasmid stabilization system protein ParE
VRPPTTILSAAEGDLAEAFVWYETQRSGLGAEFFAEVRAAITRIEDGPTRYPIAIQGVHRAPVRRFPYSVYFTAAGDRIVVLAVLHHRRNPAALRKRPKDE